MNGYNKWRDGEIKRIGLTEQRKAENKLDNHNSQPLKEITDSKTGKKQVYREEVAEILSKRDSHERSKLVFSVPALPWKDNK